MANANHTHLNLLTVSPCQPCFSTYGSFTAASDKYSAVLLEWSGGVGLFHRGKTSRLYCCSGDASIPKLVERFRMEAELFARSFLRLVLFYPILPVMPGSAILAGELKPRNLAVRNGALFI